MNDQKILPDSEETSATEKETHPLIKIGVLSIGTKIGATIILNMAKHPVALFSMGIAAGFYANKNRQEIIDAAIELKEQGIKVITKKDSDD
jgi:hypothetical protein